MRPADILPAVVFWILQRSATALGAQTKKSVFRLNHERFRWRVGNAELFFHEIEVDRALRCAMLFKLLLVISSAVEESLTSQGRVAPFFTHRLRLEYHDRTWSRRQIVRDPSTSHRSAQDDKRESSARSVMLCSADELAESTRHGRSHARRLIFGPRMHTFCHPERKRGTSPMAVDHTS